VGVQSIIVLPAYVAEASKRSAVLVSIVFHTCQCTCLVSKSSPCHNVIFCYGYIRVRFRALIIPSSTTASQNCTDCRANVHFIFTTTCSLFFVANRGPLRLIRSSAARTIPLPYSPPINNSDHSNVAQTFARRPILALTTVRAVQLNRISQLLALCRANL
jgi:hypothetical protein